MKRHGAILAERKITGVAKARGIRCPYLVSKTIASSPSKARIESVRVDGSLRQCGNVPWGCRDGQAERLPTGHEDVLTAVVVERFPSESAIESFEAQARDVEEPQPFVLGCPPERTGSTIVQGDVDSVIADAVVVRVRHPRVDMLAVYGECDVMVEGERAPGEAAVRPK